MSSSGVHKKTRALLGTLLGGLLSALLVFVAAPAWAHDELIGSDPAADAVVDVLPDQIELTFSGVLLAEAGATEVRVVDASCASLTAGDPVLDGVRLTQSLTGSAAGPVTVLWRVVSSDGHPISDEFTFSVGEVGTATPCTDAVPQTDSDGDGAGAGARVVWIVIGVIAVGLGGALVAVLVARARRSRED